MILTSVQWKEILNSNKGNMLEAIKEKLKEKHEDIYQEWKEKDFNVDHFFDVSFTINDQQRNLKLTLLHIAAFNGNLDIVKYLVDDKNVSLDQKDNDGRTALHGAAFSGHLDIVKCLVDKGANPLIKNKDGETPRNLANDENIIQLLKDAETQQPSPTR